VLASRARQRLAPSINGGTHGLFSAFLYADPKSERIVMSISGINPTSTFPDYTTIPSNAGSANPVPDLQSRVQPDQSNFGQASQGSSRSGSSQGQSGSLLQQFQKLLQQAASMILGALPLIGPMLQQLSGALTSGSGTNAGGSS
jgi:hypothetical protein